MLQLLGTSYLEITDTLFIISEDFHKPGMHFYNVATYNVYTISHVSHDK